MDASTTFDEFLTATDLDKGKGLLVEGKKTGISLRESHFLDLGKNKIGANALFLQHSSRNGSCFPLAYFRKLEDPDPNKIAETHKLAWNLGQAPLLFIVIPGQVLVYSTYMRPKRKAGEELDEQAGLIDIISFLASAQKARQSLNNYKREELLSGRYWEKNKDHFNSEFRVEKTLLQNLAALRKILIKQQNLHVKIVHKLIGRSIFIQYLLDRRDELGKSVFPEGFFDEYKAGAENFIGVLGDKKATYRLFNFLERKFSGDIFPVDYKEERTVADIHLNLLADFLRGDMELPNGQLGLWPYYSFNAIPIEFISNLYEEFFHYEREEFRGRAEESYKPKTGTHYTPHRLVDFLMDEVFPWDGKEVNIRIFDPACGSAIFLVEAYKRLIARWQQQNKTKRLSDKVLKDLLTKNIFGVDSNIEAIRIASFSLYLTMCDYLKPRDIWERVEFPRLRNNNLWDCDFFEFVQQPPATVEKFDLIIGNPPWESDLTEAAKDYIEKSGHSIGDKQIAQAFLWAAPEICSKKGEIVLIAPSKGLLFNLSSPNIAFRKEFFSSFEVKTIFNFSALRKNLFPKASGPAAPVFYKPIPPSKTKKILYCNPKPSYSPEDNWHYVIGPQDIAYVPVDSIENSQNIWKIAMWGTPRDLELIQKLSGYPNLNKICDSRGWISGEGFIKGKSEGKENREEANWLTNKPYVTPDTMCKFYFDERELPLLKEKYFTRPRKEKKEIFEGPHLLITQSPKKSKGFIAALLRKYMVFSQALVGISGPKKEEKILGAACLAINSYIPIYYSMLTSSRWLVERDELAKKEIMSFPMPKTLLEGKEEVTYDELKELARKENLGSTFQPRIASLYDLNEDEMTLVHDAIEYTLDYFINKNNSKAAKRPSKGMLMAYGQTLCKILNDSFKQKRGEFSASILYSDAPMIVAHIEFRPNDRKSKTKVLEAPDNLFQAIIHVDKILTEEGSGGVYIQRNVRIYDGLDIYIIKRNQCRFWKKSDAFRDADDSYADIMKSYDF